MHDRRGEMRARIVLLLLATGCGVFGGGPQLPFTSSDAVVNEVRDRGPLIDARVKGGGFELRLLFPSEPDCAEILRPEARVRYVAKGAFGRVESKDGDACVPLGIADLETWRDRRPRADRRLLPSAQARWRPLRKDPEVLLVRGRFPLANRIGMSGPLDLVAMLPNTPECMTVVQRGIATMVYRDTGRDVFRLLIDPGLCPIIGFATPPPALDRKKQEDE
jgi:hypothetical protein